ncbi:MAG: N-acetyl-gamma-glutamyl-phosphate reductase [Thermodesulfobacteriota bacterium]
MSIKAGVLGGTGYTGTQLVSLLLNHEEVEVKWITSEKFKNRQYYESFPYLNSLINIECKSISQLDELDEVDIVFSCLPNLTSMHFVHKLIEKNTRVIDLSSDFRFKNLEMFKNVFNSEHSFKELNKKAVYGLSEINREKIKQSPIVANPGCFATSVILPLIPLFEKNLISDSEIIIDIKSPISGAGRAPRLDYHFPESNQNVSFDSFGKHFQKMEIKEHFGEKYGFNKDLVFMIHRIPVDRGIMSTIYVKLNSGFSTEEIGGVISDHYSDDKFIRIRNYNEPVNLKNVLNSNFCDIGFGMQDEFLIIESVIDNLIKGASGQAVQNMNIMFGLDEKTGLEFAPLYP